LAAATSRDRIADSADVIIDLIGCPPERSSLLPVISPGGHH
jgi:hypothetical protein